MRGHHGFALTFFPGKGAARVYAGIHGPGGAEEYGRGVSGDGEVKR